MGYRSDVAIVTEITNEELIEACKLSKPNNVTKYVISVRDGYNAEIQEPVWKDIEIVNFYFESRKWYNEYPTVKVINRAMSNLEEIDSDNFGFIEIGEDISDIDYRGNPFELGLNITRKIFIDPDIITKISFGTEEYYGDENNEQE